MNKMIRNSTLIMQSLGLYKESPVKVDRDEKERSVELL
jgi:hypothetical protein